MLTALHAPGRVEPVFAGMIKEDHVSGRIPQACLAPEPGLVHGVVDEGQAAGLQFRDLRIEVGALEVHGGRRAAGVIGCRVHGKRAVADGGLEPRIVRRADDQLETHGLVEGHGGRDILRGEGDLVQLHAGEYQFRDQAGPRAGFAFSEPPRRTCGSQEIHNSTSSSGTTHDAHSRVPSLACSPCT